MKNLSNSDRANRYAVPPANPDSRTGTVGSYDNGVGLDYAGLWAGPLAPDEQLRLIPSSRDPECIVEDNSRDLAGLPQSTADLEYGFST